MSTARLVWGRFCCPSPGRVLADAGCLVEAGRITAVGPVAALRAQAPGAEELGGADHCCTPGLVDAHSHGNAVDALARGIPDASLEPWIHALAGGPVLDAGLDARIAGVHKLEAGVTTVVHHAYERDPAALDAVCAAHTATGIRALVAIGISDQNRLVHDGEAALLAALPPDLRPLARELAGVKLGDGAEWLALASDARRRHAGPRLRFGLGPSGPHWCSDALWERIAEASADAAWPVHTHLAESPLEAAQAARAWGRSAVAHLQALGVCTPRAAFAHAIWCDATDWELLAASGVTVVHNPGSNLRLRNGTAPVPAMRDAGVALALGTDDTTLAGDHDLLAEARLAWRLHPGSPAHRPLDATDVWRMCTEGGARVAGFGPGTLAVGAPADLVLFRLDRLLAPLPVAPAGAATTLLARGGAPAVDLVLVGGEVVVRAGRHTASERDAWEAAWQAGMRAAPRRHRLAAAALLLRPHLARFYEGWAEPS